MRNPFRWNKDDPPPSKILDGLGEPIAPLDVFTSKPVQLEPGTRASDRPELAHTVNADERGPSPAAIQQGGTAYQPTLKEVASMSPAIGCPKCGSVVTGLTDAKPEFKPSGEMPLELNRHVYRVEGCGCQVTQEWAGGITAEVTHRQAGGVPRAVVDMTPLQRQTLFRTLEKRLHKLMDDHPDQLLRHASITTQIGYLMEVMQYITKPQTVVAKQQPKIAEKIYNDQVKKIDAAIAADLIKQQATYGAPSSAAEAADFGYGTKYPAPKLGGTAASMGQAMASPTMEGAPSPALLKQAEELLRQADDWVGLIAGAFPNCLAMTDRDRMRNKILESLDRYRTSGILLCQEVHAFMYFMVYGTKQPLKPPLYTPQTAVQTAVPSTAPITRSLDTLSPKPAAPVDEAAFHDRFQRKKRKVRRPKEDDDESVN